MIPPSFIFEAAHGPSVRTDRADWFGTGFIAFLAIGAGAALLYVLLVQIFLPLVLVVPSWVVSVVTYGVLIVPTYLMHRRYAFRSEVAHERALPRYILVQIMSLALVAGFSWLAYGVVSLDHLPAAILVIGLTAGVNFLVLKLYAFASR